MKKKLRNHLNKKGFTLVEVIVVLVILAVIIALAVPSVIKYIDDANDVKDDIKVSYLNKASEGYRVRMYKDKKWSKGSDLFAGITTSKERQKALLDAKWIDEYQTSIYDSNDYFNWDIKKQKWTRKPSGSSGGEMSDEEKKENETILGDIGKGEDKGPWVKGDTYKYGDVIEVNGVKYKCIYTPKTESTKSNYGPVYSGGNIDTFWKAIVIDFDATNNYETGDIILYNKEYYKATGFDSSNDFMAYYNASGSMHYDSQIIRSLFTKVVWENGAFVEVQ